MNEIRDDIVTEARRWKGTPYKHQGRILGKACDCTGLIIKVRESLFGIPDKWSTNYSRHPRQWNIKHVMDAELIPIEFSKVQVGDVLLLTIAVEPQHVGIISSYSERSFGLIHCYSTIGRVVEHRLNDVWINRVTQAYMIPEVKTWQF